MYEIFTDGKIKVFAKYKINWIRRRERAVHSSYLFMISFCNWEIHRRILHLKGRSDDKRSELQTEIIKQMQICDFANQKWDIKFFSIQESSVFFSVLLSFCKNVPRLIRVRSLMYPKTKDAALSIVSGETITQVFYCGVVQACHLLETQSSEIDCLRFFLRCYGNLYEVRNFVKELNSPGTHCVAVDGDFFVVHHL